mgnify:CR=1 FL=1
MTTRSGWIRAPTQTLRNPGHSLDRFHAARGFLRILATSASLACRSLASVVISLPRLHTSFPLSPSFSRTLVPPSARSCSSRSPFLCFSSSSSSKRPWMALVLMQQKNFMMRTDRRQTCCPEYATRTCSFLSRKRIFTDIKEEIEARIFLCVFFFGRGS